MRWLFCTMILVCCISVSADRAQTKAGLNLIQKPEKPESDLNTDDRLKRIEKLVDLLLEEVYEGQVNQEQFRGEIMSRLEEIEGKLDDITGTSGPPPTTQALTTTEPPTPVNTTGSKNCQDVYANGGRVSGVYSISPNGTEQVQVFCEQELKGGGWTVFQRRMDGSEDFQRGWEDYKQGFGNAAGEYWIGNDHLHQLTANQDTQLLVELDDEDREAIAQYSEFWVGSENKRYEIHVTGYFRGMGYPGDALINHNGDNFGTWDNYQNGLNCSQKYSGGWWFHEGCYACNLNGLYNADSDSLKGIIWFTFRGWSNPIAGVRMMLKTK